MIESNCDNRARISRVETFNTEFENQLPKHKTMVEAYEATEEHFRQRLVQAGMQPFECYYSSYNSFKVQRSRYMKAKRHKPCNA